MDLRTAPPMKESVALDEWMRQLNEEVIQGAFGYEEGEFQAFPELWQPFYEQGLTPQEAFKRALDAHSQWRPHGCLTS